MTTRRILIDTDPGIDDAVALLLALASPELAVEAIVAVAGNGPLHAMERNARAICELAGRGDIPVYAGCPRPLRGDAITAIYFHGESGLGTSPSRICPGRRARGRGSGIAESSARV